MLQYHKRARHTLGLDDFPPGAFWHRRWHRRWQLRRRLSVPSQHVTADVARQRRLYAIMMQCTDAVTLGCACSPATVAQPPAHRTEAVGIVWTLLGRIRVRAIQRPTAEERAEEVALDPAGVGQGGFAAKRV